MNQPTTKSYKENQLKLDVYQTASEVVIKAVVANTEPRDVEIDVANDILTIKGTTDKNEEVGAKTYYHKECHFGPFSRSVILPPDIDTTNIKAVLKNGVLTIRLHKSEKIQTQKIKIQSE